AGLKQIAEGLAQESIELDPQHEDVHSAVEALLRESMGPVAGKLHTARSRNDQVATDTRLYLREQIVSIDAALPSVQETMVSLAENELGSPTEPTTQRPNDRKIEDEYEGDSRPSTITSTKPQHPTPNTHPPTILPGFTHLQHAQPVLLSHHFLAYFWMFQ